MSTKTIDMNLFEAQLQDAMHPVRPSRSFVTTMRKRIKIRPAVEMAQRLSDQPSLLLILGGVLSVSLLIITLARGIFYLTNRTKFL
jgi:hypothetical protein